MDDNLQHQIKQRGYWRVNFRPLSDEDRVSRLQMAEDSVTQSAVRLRGWPYPFASREPGQGSNGIELHDQYVLGWVDWDQHREFWRMYKSSQYISYRSTWEDWPELSSWGPPRGPYTQDRKELSVLGAIYQVAEFFAFLGRLRERKLYAAGVIVHISLQNAGPRILRSEGANRMPFMFDKVSHAPEIRVTRTFSGLEAEATAENATSTLLELFDSFGWNPPASQIANDVEPYLAGRLT